MVHLGKKAQLRDTYKMNKKFGRLKKMRPKHGTRGKIKSKYGKPKEKEPKDGTRKKSQLKYRKKAQISYIQGKRALLGDIQGKDSKYDSDSNLQPKCDTPRQMGHQNVTLKKKKEKNGAPRKNSVIEVYLR